MKFKKGEKKKIERDLAKRRGILEKRGGGKIFKEEKLRKEEFGEEFFRRFFRVERKRGRTKRRVF